jgi:hypothetical protein
MPKAPTQRKQARDAGSPFTFRVAAVRGAHPALTVTLSIPRDDDECPLTLETIRASRLDFLPDAVFCPERPQHSKLTLPCGHGFHALSLLYSWCKNGMRCPCCRAGHKGRADPACLPGHFRAAMADRVRETLGTEREADRPVRIYGVTVPYSALSRAGCLMMTMAFFERVDSAEPLFAFTARLDESDRGTPERPVFTPRWRPPPNFASSRLGAVQLQVQLDVPMEGSLGIDASRPVAIAEGTTSVPGAHEHFISAVSGVRHPGDISQTQFEITAVEGMGGLTITGLRWCPGGQFMEIMSVEE